MDLIKFLADGLLFIILGVAGSAGIYYVLRTHQTRKLLPVAILAALTSVLSAKVASLIWQPNLERPYALQGLEAGASYINNPGFPSDHVLLAVVIVIMLAVLTPYKKLAMFLAVLILAMSIGRVLALVHSPIDIIGGVVFGLLGSLWYLKQR